MRIIPKKRLDGGTWRRAFAWLPVRLTEDPVIVWLEPYEYNEVRWTDRTRTEGPYSGNGQSRLPREGANKPAEEGRHIAPAHEVFVDDDGRVVLEVRRSLTPSLRA